MLARWAASTGKSSWVCGMFQLELIDADLNYAEESARGPVLSVAMLPHTDSIVLCHVSSLVAFGCVSVSESVIALCV